MGVHQPLATARRWVPPIRSCNQGWQFQAYLIPGICSEPRLPLRFPSWLRLLYYFLALPFFYRKLCLFILIIAMQISTTWDNNEFQNALQMGLIPNLPHNGMELDNNGKSP